MAKQRFRLAPLKRLREAIRDEKRASLAEALRAQEILSEQCDDVERHLIELSDSARRAMSPGRVNVDQLLYAGRYELMLRSKQQLLTQQAQELAAEVDRRQQILAEANRDVRVLEKLEERHATRRREAEEKREQQILDEVAGRRHRESD
jgi:flagellar export protein FliJ